MNHKIDPYGTYEDTDAWITPMGDSNIVHYDCPLCAVVKKQPYNIVYYCQKFCHNCDKSKICKNFNPDSCREEREIERSAEEFS